MVNMILFLLCFLCGAVPFSYLLGLLFGKDVRDFGEDHNPGPTNSFKAGGAALGIPSLALDFLKGAIPVFMLTSTYDLSPVTFVLVCIAPVLGHMLTPLLRFKGGKGITTTFGIWSGLTLWEVPVFLGSFFTMSVVLKHFLTGRISDKATVITASLLLPAFTFFRFHDSQLFALAVINSMLLIVAQFREQLGI